MTTDQPIAVRLYFVRNEKEDYYKKKRQFTLRDVKTVDGINPRKVNCILIAFTEYVIKSYYLTSFPRIPEEYLSVAVDTGVRIGC